MPPKTKKKSKPKISKRLKLTPKQALFVQHYIKDKNATRAYIAAGYSSNGAGQEAFFTLKKPHVRDAVDTALARLAHRTQVSAERVINGIAFIAFDDDKAQRFDKLRALEMLGKHFKVFTEVSEEHHTVEVVDEAKVKAMLEKIEKDC